MLQRNTQNFFFWLLLNGGNERQLSTLKLFISSLVSCLVYLLGYAFWVTG